MIYQKTVKKILEANVTSSDVLFCLRKGLKYYIYCNGGHADGTFKCKVEINASFSPSHQKNKMRQSFIGAIILK